MNATEFAFWLRGVMSTTMTPGDQAALVIAEVRRGLGSEPVKAAPPQMTAILVSPFCVHNVHINEHCIFCGSARFRIFGVRLENGVKLVYINAHGDTDSRDEGDDANPTEAAERS